MAVALTCIKAQDQGNAHSAEISQHACSFCCQALMPLAPFPVSQHRPAAPVCHLSLQVCYESNVPAEAYPPLRVQLLQLLHL